MYLYFWCLIALAGASSSWWNRNSDSGHSSLFKRSSVALSSWSTAFAAVFLVDALYQVKEALVLPRVCYRCWIWSFDLLVWSYGFLLSLMWGIILKSSLMLEQPWIRIINFTWLWCLLKKICQRLQFLSVLMSELALILLSHSVLIWFWY